MHGAQRDNNQNITIDVQMEPGSHNKVRFFSNDNDGSRNNSMDETMEGWNKHNGNIYPKSNASHSTIDKNSSRKKQNVARLRK